jgi:hypothetical protein
VKFSKRAVLRAGFAAVIGVLVLSALEAYRIQSSVSRQHLEIYRHYVDQEATLATLRRNLWLAGNEVRDFFIHPTPAQAQILRTQLDALRAEDEQALDHLARTSPRAEDLAKLRQSLNEFWAVVDPVAQTMLHESSDREFEFIQREIVPRRGELYSALLNLTAADQQRLQESEREFADARRRAARLLVVMLAFSVLLSMAVARFSLVHAESLERRAQLDYEELQHLSARLLEIEEEGRRKLSRELHDEIGQTLALLQIEISHAAATIAVQPAAARERLQRARELAEKTVQTVRTITAMLRPALLDDWCLPYSISSRISRAAAASRPIWWSRVWPTACPTTSRRASTASCRKLFTIARSIQKRRPCAWLSASFPSP